MDTLPVTLRSLTGVKSNFLLLVVRTSRFLFLAGEMAVDATAEEEEAA